MEKAERTVSVRSLCITAVLTAVVFIMTFVPKIPIPLGYAHLGDAVIFLTILFTGRKNAALAAAIGSALSDLIGGFPLWIVPTLLIKWIMVEIVYRIVRPEGRTWSILSLKVILAFLISSLWMAGAYTVAGGILYGSMGAALASTPGLLMEGALNTAAALIAGTILEKAGAGHFGE